MQGYSITKCPFQTISKPPNVCEPHVYKTISNFKELQPHHVCCFTSTVYSIKAKESWMIGAWHFLRRQILQDGISLPYSVCTKHVASEQMKSVEKPTREVYYVNKFLLFFLLLKILLTSTRGIIEKCVKLYIFKTYVNKIA